MTQPAGTVSTCTGSGVLRRGPSFFNSSMGSVSNGKVRPPACKAVSPELSPERCSRVLALVSNSSAGFTANGTITSPGSQLGHPLRISSQSALTPQHEQIAFTASPQPSPTGNTPSANNNNAAVLPLQCNRVSKIPEKVPLGPAVVSQAMSPQQGVTPQRPASPQDQPVEQQPVVLSTNSPAALKVGTQQIIPKNLASEIKVTSKANIQNAETSKRVLKVRSMVESLSVPLVADAEEEAEGDLDSPGTLRRGLRSTSYRRAVVSGVDFDSSSNFMKKNRMSQPILKAVVEDKEKFSSLGRIKVSCADR